MKSIFNPADNQEIINRINKLTPETKAEWGKMNPAQMLAHLQTPISVAFGELKLSKNLMGILFGRIAKKKLINEEPFKKNLPTDKKFIVKDERNFDEEKKKIVSFVKRLVEGGPKGLSKEPHPFFGELTPQEWDTLMIKHLDHHLRQFGV